MASRTWTCIYVQALLVCGSLNTITMKVAFTMSGTADGHTERFEKPWLMTFIMFVSMTLALPFDAGMWKRSAPPEPLLGQVADHWRGKVIKVMIPAFFDILATGLCCMGFLYIPASVWQLLRGAEIVFAAIFAVTCLHRRLYCFQYIGLAFCVAGIFFVGLASVWGGDSEEEEADGKDSGNSEMLLLGICLALAGQVVQAAQAVAEEWLLQDVDLPGLQVVGFEGVWGSLAMLAFVFPTLYTLPGQDHGRAEDEGNAFQLLRSNPMLSALMALYIFSCATYNISGIAVTGALSAVHRVMIEALRSLIVWAFGLGVHYLVDDKSPFGETWTPYSWLEVAGFVLLMIGQVIYGAMLKIPRLYYPPAEEISHDVVASPGSLRNLSAAPYARLVSPGSNDGRAQSPVRIAFKKAEDAVQVFPYCSRVATSWFNNDNGLAGMTMLEKTHVTVDSWAFSSQHGLILKRPVALLIRVLQCLEAESLLEATLLCRDVAAAVKPAEYWLWRQLFEKERRSDEWADESEEPESGALRKAEELLGSGSELSAKLAFRLRRYLARRRMPSLPDALRCAADHGHQAVLELLLHLRADPNVPADTGAYGVGFTQVGAYPLHLAAKRGRLEVMEVLLKAGASIDAADQNGRTGLMVAAASGQHAAILWLLCHRAAADCMTHYGYTALHYAALVPRPEVVHALLEGRASSNVVDREGRSALHAALSTLPRARTEGLVMTTSFDPSGIGDEYCYENDISHGYRRNEQEEAQVQAVQKAVTALVRHGADASQRDCSGRSAIDVVQDCLLESDAHIGINGWTCRAEKVGVDTSTGEAHFEKRVWHILARQGQVPKWTQQRCAIKRATTADKRQCVAVTEHCEKGEWCALPDNFLSANEAFEFALLRINEMRQKCYGFTLAPVRRQDYTVAGTVRKDMEGYSIYKLLLKPTNKFVPTAVEVEVAHLHRITDLSIFQVTKVKPLACSLFSAADDAELLIPTNWQEAKEAAETARTVFNEQRKTFCPERPQLQLLRILAAARQPAEGKVLRLQLEMREEIEAFGRSSGSFEEQVLVSYALDHSVPEEMALAPEVYAGRYPCKMVHQEDEQTALDFFNASRRLGGQVPERRLSWDPTSASEAAAAAGRDHQLERPFEEQGLDLPDNFDPRVEKTLCFPRGISRHQGSCGSSWAFAATAVASFRECLVKLHGGEEPASLSFLSAQELVSCSAHHGCSGGSAAEAFYYMKQHGVARETCSPYRMRCFHDQSTISMEAADFKTAVAHAKSSEAATMCHEDADTETTSCKCLPSVFHLTSAVACDLLPAACPKTRLPSYFKILGIMEGNTVPELERHMMQELITDGPLYVSFLLYQDFFDSTSWSESGIYEHKHGDALGRHGAALIGWGTDMNSRDYWLLLNSFGMEWQQGGYFKVLRGDTATELLHYGAWGADFQLTEDEKKRAPAIFAVEVSFSPVPLRHGIASEPLTELAHVWLRVAFATDEPAKALVRVLGLASGMSAEVSENLTTANIDKLGDVEGGEGHIVQIDLMKHDLLGDRLELRVWASDKAENTGSWGPVAFDVPALEVFRKSLSGVETSRRLEDGGQVFSPVLQKESMRVHADPRWEVDSHDGLELHI
ncbi:SLC35F6 [Symbiodinium natans]|uniref:SLC35F6 protein n=1 Tax=Symbiodinium natans TaxID=878477 RepID=A0A812JR63_9DINO|nr:SLC35F6 [Symbiodinium natans]